jgi:alpha-beta hydrolase superfamily lysophospholipase
VSDLLAKFPTSLRRRSRLLSLGPAPGLLVEPEPGDAPAPLVLWLHGRTVRKEIDSARFSRLLRAGIAVAAIDLPGHGERLDERMQEPDALPDVLAAALDELPEVEQAVLAELGQRIDPSRRALGGVSAGGMVSLRRLCDDHPYRCAAVEATCGDLGAAQDALEASGSAAPLRYTAARERDLSARDHLEGWRPLPLLVLHSEADQVVPAAGQRAFVDTLRDHHRARGADPELVRLVTWPETGAPMEHLGFGAKSGEARQLHLEFLQAHL